MKPNNHTQRIIFLAFLLSLLFHFSGIVYIVIKPYLNNSTKDESKIPQPQPELQPNSNKQKSNEWVETKARAGNFGTPVFFQDDFEPAVAEAMPDKPAATETPNDTPEAIETQSAEQIKPETIEPKPEDTVKNQGKIEEIAIQQKNMPTSQSYLPEATKDKPTSIVTQKPEIKPATPKHIVQQKTVQTKHQSQSAKQLSGPKPPLTLAQLSQGFLNHVKDEGKHAIHMLGKRNGTPSDEQMRYERYLQKLSWCLQNSFNIYNERFPHSANIKDNPQVLLALNKDGSLKHCHVSKTSGDRNLDHFVTFIFNDASTSFPPVPQSLPHDPFAITYIIMMDNSDENRWRLYRQ